MSHSLTVSRPTTIGRVVHDGRGRRIRRSLVHSGPHSFESGDTVQSLTRVENDGIDPHRDIGETLVCPGDTGIVRDSWRFLGEDYHTVEFATRDATVIMRGREMTRAAHRRIHRARHSINAVRFHEKDNG